MNEEASQIQPQTIGRSMDSDLTRWMEHIEDVLTQLEHDLAGEIYDDESGEWREVPGARIMNDRGINATTKFIRAYANRNTFFSDLSEERVLDICRHASFAFNDLLFYNWQEFEINLTYYSTVHNEVITIIEMALRRAISGAERASITKLEQVHRVYQTTEQPRGGILGMLRGSG